MANNRYYLTCPVCKDEYFMGKSLGSGVYNMRSMSGKMFSPSELLQEMTSPIAEEKAQYADGEVLEEIYEFIWKHMINCHKDEFKSGTLFTVESEYK